MLSIIFGRENVPKELVPKVVLDSRSYFSLFKKPEWFEDPFVKEFLKSVDNTTVLFEEALKDYRGRGISTEMISTGCKTVCCILHNSEKIFHGSLMGDNCLPFLLRIVEKSDRTVLFEHLARFPEEAFEKGLIYHNGKKLETFDDYVYTYCDWSDSTKEDDYFDRVVASGL